MFSKLKLPLKEIPPEDAMEIVHKATGKTPHEIKKFYKTLNTKEAQRVINNKFKLNQNQFRKLLSDTHKNGFFVDSKKLKKKLKEIQKAESQRKIQYSKGRNKLAQRLERLKMDGEASFLVREIEKKMQRENLGAIDRRRVKAEKVHETILEIQRQHTNNKKQKNIPKKENFNDAWRGIKKDEPSDLMID